MTASKLRELIEGDPLVDREIEVLYGAALGETAAETGKNIYLGVETVRQYRKSAIAKLGARNITNAVAVAIGTGILNIDTIMEAVEANK